MAFKELTQREDIGIILISQYVRHLHSNMIANVVVWKSNIFHLRTVMLHRAVNISWT